MRKANYKRHFMFMKTLLASLVLLPLVFVPCARPAEAGGSPFYNVRAFGATGDGKTLDSPAINKAIEACAEAGGGTVCSPGGHLLERLHSDEEQYSPAD